MSVHLVDQWWQFLCGSFLSASEGNTNLSNILDIKLKYMDNRSIDQHSKNLTIHSSNDCDSKLLYMIKLFYKHSEDDDTEELYLGFRKSSQIINNNYHNYLSSFKFEDNITFSEINHLLFVPKFIVLKMMKLFTK
jgi:hypothetical protein